MQINIQIETEEEKESLLERIETALEAMEVGHKDPSHWNFIKQLNNYLMRKKKCGKCTPQQKQILRKIAPAVNRYGRRSGDVLHDEEMSKYVD